MNEPRESERDDEFLERLRAELRRLDAADPAGRFAVAFSGGGDSSVLLAAMARLYPAAKLRALHVDHGLHADSRDWADRAAEFAAELGIAFARRRIDLGARRGESLEALARERRYAALADMLEPGDVLLTAHQADDQLETLLQRLFRGTGVRGLRGVHAAAPLPPGRLLRPLLAFSRAELRVAAERWRLRWIEDPANSALDFDRSYVRAKLVPLVLERWPAAPFAAARLARQMDAAEHLLEALAAADAAALEDLGRIPCSAVRALEPARRSNLLRYAIRALGLPTPSAARLAELEATLERLAADTHAKVSWPGADARFYRDHLYLLPALVPFAGAPARLTAGEPLRGAHGTLRFVEAHTADGLPDEWARAGLDVRFRCGGERFKPLGGAHRRTLKNWMQDRGIVPWMRARIPLLYRRDELVAIADLALGDAARTAASSGPRWRVEWTEHPRVA